MDTLPKFNASSCPLCKLDIRNITRVPFVENRIAKISHHCSNGPCVVRMLDEADFERRTHTCFYRPITCLLCKSCVEATPSSFIGHLVVNHNAATHSVTRNVGSAPGRFNVSGSDIIKQPATVLECKEGEHIVQLAFVSVCGGAGGVTRVWVINHPSSVSPPLESVSITVEWKGAVFTKSVSVPLSMSAETLIPTLLLTEDHVFTVQLNRKQTACPTIPTRPGTPDFLAPFAWSINNPYHHTAPSPRRLVSFQRQLEDPNIYHNVFDE